MNRKPNSFIREIFLFILIPLFFSACVKTENAVDPLSIKTWQVYNKSSGLADNSVWSLAEDKDGNIWAGTLNNGVSKFDGKNWTSYNETNGLLDNSVLAITQDRDGDMWFGTLGGISILTSNGWINNPEPLNSFSFAVYALLTDSKENVWMGTTTLGLIKYDNSSWYQYFDSQCDICNTINEIIEDDNQNIWYGTEGDLKKLSSSSLTSYKTTNGLPQGSIQALHQDMFGNIWVGTFGGAFVAKFSNGSFKPVSLANGMPMHYVTSVSSDKLGNVWFGLVADGAVKYNGSFMNSYFEKDGLPDNTIMTMLKDSKGCVWFGTLEGGIVKYTPARD
jgi:ligand-binding sensor domain-containing protein